ncbi:MAG TPA: L,D-transpeptidase [Gaiellaceae bacterium]|nr:L,D-transpeptidase [Gaiellaceae bacterium]
MTTGMGRVYLPPHVVVAVALLVALGAALTMVARPAAGVGSPSPPREAEAVPVAAAPDVTLLAAAAPQAFPPAEPASEPAPEPAPPPAPAPPPGTEVLRAVPGEEIVVRARPRGAVVARLGAYTEFGSPTTLAVLERRGRWLGVPTPQVGNGRLGWVDPRESDFRSSHTRVRVTIDLSARRLSVRRGGRVLLRMVVGIGSPSSPTPVGRFAVTDKIPGSRYGPYYGCCIVALTARQPLLPAGWRGGDRVAVHGTDDPSSVGAAVSAGCPRARDADLRRLMRLVPLGAPVVVQR